MMKKYFYKLYCHVFMLCDYEMSAKLVVFHNNLLSINCIIAVTAVTCVLCDLRVNRKVLVHESVRWRTKFVN